MAFKADYSKATNGSEKKPEGDYECIITGVEERRAKTGTRYLNFTLTIRNDVEGQRYGNACLFFPVYEKIKDPSEEDASANGFNFAILMGIAKAAGLPKDKEYKDFNDFLANLQNKCVVAHYADGKDKDKDGEPRREVRWLNPTKHPNCRHVFKSKSPVVSGETFASSSDGNAQFAAAAAGAIGSASDDTYPF